MAAAEHLVTPSAENAFGQIKEKKREHDYGHHESVAHRILVQVGDHAENLHGNDFAKFENQRRAELGESPDEHDDGSGEIAGKH